MNGFTRVRAEARDGTLLAGLARLDRVTVMSLVFGIGLVSFLAIEPTQNWTLLLLAGLVGLGVDGIVRTHPRARFRRLDDTALYLFVPVLFTLAAGLFLEEAAEGYWTVPAGLGAAFPFAAIVHSEYNSVHRKGEGYPAARLVLNVATYVIAFLFYATVYDFELGLFTTTFAVGVVTLLLAVEILREEAMETPRTLLYAVAVSILLAETAWALHFLPLEGSVAAVFLLLAFYLVSGLTHNYLGERLTLRTASEFMAIATLGLGVIVAARTLV
ncbi:MAG: hypothetical protein HYS09_08110 [Chloroflexi bacterium]|nr:hypothetical protein [Chloroflexota bacterium]